MARKKQKGLPYPEKVARYGKERMAEQKRRYYLKNRESHKAKVYAYRAADKERWLKANREYQQKRAQADPDYWRKKAIKKQYGIAFEQYEGMLKAQDNKCEICGDEFSQTDGRKRPHIDHCHATDVVRGVLCALCNVMLGSARDDETILSRAMQYLARARRKEHAGA